MDAIYNVFGCKIKLFHGVFSLNYAIINTNNKIRNENPASTGSLAGSKRVFFLHSICLARACARTNEPVANLLHQSGSTAGSLPGFRQKKSKAGRKRIANPHILVDNLVENQVSDQVCS